MKGDIMGKKKKKSGIFLKQGKATWNPEDPIDNDIMDSAKVVVSFRPRPVPIKRTPKQKSIPPLRALPLTTRYDLMRDFPEAILKKLRGRKPNQSLNRYGVPKKVTMSPYDIQEFKVISSYMVSSEAKLGGYATELFVPFETQLFWLNMVVYRPNKPYLLIIAAEDDGPAANLLAAYLINYYRNLSTHGTLDFMWYRSLEFISMKQIQVDQGVVVIQCRHPSWVETSKQLLRTIQNARAVFENTMLILTVYEEDLDIVPYILADEPYGAFLKVGIEEELLALTKPQTALWNKLEKSILQAKERQ
jgi:hypothetical protein